MVSSLVYDVYVLNRSILQRAIASFGVESGGVSFYVSRGMGREDIPVSMDIFGTVLLKFFNHSDVVSLWKSFLLYLDDVMVGNLISGDNFSYIFYNKQHIYGYVLYSLLSFLRSMGRVYAPVSLLCTSDYDELVFELKELRFIEGI